jgi:hypothetical protein
MQVLKGLNAIVSFLSELFMLFSTGYWCSHFECSPIVKGKLPLVLILLIIVLRAVLAAAK